MRAFRLFALLAAVSLAGVSMTVAAGPKPASKPPKVTAKAPKASVPKSGPSAKSASSAKGASSAKSAKATTKSKSGKKSTAETASTSTTTTGSDTDTDTDTDTDNGTGTGDNENGDTDTDPTTTEPNAVSTKISSNPGLSAKVQAMLPADMTLEQATAGFRNQGQFLAALNAAQKNNISFADLQTAMTVDGLNLGQAVKKVKNTPPAPAPPPQDEL